MSTIREGPTKGYLLPLQFDLLSSFVDLFKNEASRIFTTALQDREPLVAGNALLALSWIDRANFSNHVSTVADRTEQICSICGSFGWDGSLAEYAVRLSEG